jgi:hypothetical protein
MNWVAQIIISQIVLSVIAATVMLLIWKASHRGEKFFG